jgi:hypothetical protein
MLTVTRSRYPNTPRGIEQVLLDAEVPVRSLNRLVAERQLDLLNGHFALVGEFGEGAAYVVRRELEADVLCSFRDDQIDSLRGKRLPCHAADLVYCPEQSSFANSYGGRPLIDRHFRPSRDRHGADPLSLPDEVDDNPASLPLLKMGDLDRNNLFPPQSDADEQSKQSAIALCF